jgi:Protein of unknown function (DUF1559)
MRYVLLVAIGLAILGLVTPVGIPGLDLLVFLVLGWIFYLARVLPEVTVAWGGVTTAITCLVFFLIGSHLFLRWLYRELASGGPLPGVWRIRWTLAAGSSVVLMFVAGMAAAGVAHQVGWLVQLKEPMFESSLPAVRRAQSTHNLKQICLAINNYADVNEAYSAGAIFDDTGRPMHGWQAMLLPFIEQQDLYNQIDFASPWNHPRNASAYQTQISVYQIPGRPGEQEADGYPVSHYAANVHVIGGDRALPLNAISDGLNSTIMVGEIDADFRPWGYPLNWRDPRSWNQQVKGWLWQPLQRRSQLRIRGWLGSVSQRFNRPQGLRSTEHSRRRRASRVGSILGG